VANIQHNPSQGGGLGLEENPRKYSTLSRCAGDAIECICISSPAACIDATDNTNALVSVYFITGEHGNFNVIHSDAVQLLDAIVYVKVSFAT
jgi:hypothetical protein